MGERLRLVKVVLLLRIASVEHAKLVRSAMALAMSLVPDEERVVFALQALRRVSVGEEEEEERCDQELLWGSLEEPFRSARAAEEIAALRWVRHLHFLPSSSLPFFSFLLSPH